MDTYFTICTGIACVLWSHLTSFHHACSYSFLTARIPHTSNCLHTCHTSSHHSTHTSWEADSSRPMNIAAWFIAW